MNNEPLMQNMNLTGKEQYDPFESPPNIAQAQRHRKAVSVGIIKNNKQSQLCFCCDNIINKQSISLCCKDQELLFLGVGYPLFYKLTKYFAMIMLLAFIVSGSAFYFFITFNCQQRCLLFLGLPIFNMDISAEESAKKTQVFNTITAICILSCVLYIKWNLSDDISNLQQKVKCPSNYAIMLQNLPDDINEKQLKEWIWQKFRMNAIEINLTYNVTELEEASKRKQQLIIKLNKEMIKMKNNRNHFNIKESLEIASSNHKIQDLTNQIKKQDRLLDMYKQQKIQCKLIGTAFVTFQKVKNVQKILDQYQCSLFNILLRNIVSVFKPLKLQFKNKIILVRKAPAPREVIWQNLQFSYIRSIGFELLFLGSITILILVAFQIQFYFVRYGFELRKQGRSSGQILIIFQALIMSLIIVILNSLLRLVTQFFAKAKKYHSYTQYEASFCAYYSLMYILNSCFMIYIVHAQTIEDSDELLLFDIHMIMLANSFSEPLYKLLDPLMWARVGWRYYLSRLPIEENPYTQAYIHKLWEGYSISNADNYQYITRVLFITIWFAHTAPLGFIFSFLGLGLDYWIGRFLLLRVYRLPENISKDIAMPVIVSLQLLPLVYICGVLEFTYKVSSSTNIFSFMYQFLQYGVTTIIILFCILGYLLFFRPKEKKLSQTPYSSVKIGFGYNYQTENPITKFKGEINYLYDVLKSNKQTEKDQEVINELLSMRRNSLDQLYHHKSKLGKLKLRMLHKVSSIQLCQQMQDIHSSQSENQAKQQGKNTVRKRLQS